MATKKNNKLSSKKILISIFASSIILLFGYFGFALYFYTHFGRQTPTGYAIQTKLKGSIISVINDSLKKMRWKYNPPKKWKNKMIGNDMNTSNNWFFIEKTDSTDAFMFYLYRNTSILTIVYTDSLRLVTRQIDFKTKKKYGNLINATVFKEIEKEALKRSFRNSEIYLDKKTLEKLGYHDFAEKIYPTKKFLFWEYD